MHEHALRQLAFAADAVHHLQVVDLFDQPNAPFAAPLDANQKMLAASMRKAWANFAATWDPSTAALHWPSFNRTSLVVSLASPQSQLDQQFCAVHHCGFGTAG